MSASVVPYLMGVWRGEFHPNVVSWVLWSVIGLVMLLSYKSTGAGDNIWMGVVSFTNPLAVAVVAIWRNGGWENPTALEWIAVGICVVALERYIRFHRNEKRAAAALYTTILADVCAATPTILLAWQSPMSEQPIPWAIYGIGALLVFLSIEKWRMNQWILPVYALFVSIAVVIPTVAHRLSAGIPFLNWF